MNTRSRSVCCRRWRWGSRGMAAQRLDLSSPCCLHLVSAFLAMEPCESLSSLARACGGGSITEQVQQFIWDHCLSRVDDFHAPYLKKFLKKLISEIELDRVNVLDELYQLCAEYMATLKDNSLVKGQARICRRISFIFPDGCSQLLSCPHSSTLIFPLQCSLNMLEGDTGCSIWPSSLFLSELILSYPKLFSNKSCFEIGSGVGLVGLCLAHVKASKVILSDGDLSTLANLKFNLELNCLNVEIDVPERTEDPSMVKCMHLPWETASESQLQNIMPDIVLGADVIYDPHCLPHLVRVFTILLNWKKNSSRRQNASCESCSPDVEVCGSNQRNLEDANDISDNRGNIVYNDATDAPSREEPVAYIACVIRNTDTYNYFLSLVDQAKLDIKDLTDSLKPLNLLPYMQSYNQASTRLFYVTYRHSKIPA